MRRFRLNVKSQYMISYMLVVLLVAILLSGGVISASVREMQASLYAQQRERAALATQDMENQLSIMRQAAANIRISRIYQPYYKNQFYSHELELIDDLTNFGTYLPYQADMYLVYRDEDIIYFNNTRANWSTLRRLYLGIDDGEDARIYESAYVSQDTRIIRVGALSDDVLFFIPIRLGYGRYTENACVMFRISGATLANRLSDISGLNNGDFAVQYNSETILGETATVSGALTASEIALVSSSGQFTLTLSQLPAESLERLVNMKRIQYGVCAVVILIGCALAVVLARQQYKPIERLSETAGSSGSSGSERTYHSSSSGSEFSRIEDFIRTTAAENEQVKREMQQRVNSLAVQSHIIDAQTIVLRRQIILLMLLGVYHPKADALPDELSDSLPYELFNVINITVSDACFDAENYARLIEELSIPDVKLCAVPLRNESSMIVLVNLKYADGMDGVLERLRNRFGDKATLVAGKVRTDIGRLPASFMQAAYMSGADSRSAELDCFTSISYTGLCGAIKNGDAASAIGFARQFVHELASRTLPYESGADVADLPTFTRMPMIELRRIFIGVAERMKALASELGADIPEESYINMLIALNVSTFENGLVQCVTGLCERENNAGEQALSGSESRVSAASILGYIDEHACESDMSLSRLEDHFGISGKSVSAAVKDITKLGFREYIIFRRIEHAKLMLLNTQLPVTTIAETSGYESTSYFIKSFRAATGKTPGQFQRDGQ